TGDQFGNSRIRFEVDGSEKMRLDTNGNVGIGTTTPAYKLDVSGSLRATGESTFTSNLLFPDNSRIKLGTGEDLQIYHDGTDSQIKNATGDLKIEVSADDKDIVFRGDDGAGGITTYFQLDGGQSQTRVFKNFKFEDNVKALFGTSDDLQIYHDGSNSRLFNITGNLVITQSVNDGDIQFFCDDGSGGTTEYFRLDGGDARTIVSREFRFLDGVASKYGNSGDLEVYHDGTNARIQNYTGALKIINNTDDGDIEFFSDDGSGGITSYFFLDGSSVTTQFYKTIKLYDSAFLYIGDSNDLQFYHNGTNST
ncbi:unnamed protein product, partial [marine sediment metagenome]